MPQTVANPLYRPGARPRRTPGKAASPQDKDVAHVLESAKKDDVLAPIKEDSICTAANGMQKGGRTRSASRRRKIQAQVQAKIQHRREAWSLQQQMLVPSASDELMDAAKKFMSEEDYQAVVDERATDGLCGYPRCRNPSEGQKDGKKWSINHTTREVYATEDISKFCCRSCLRDNAAFARCLQPEPPYCRPASAVAATLSAVANATNKRTETSGKVTRATNNSTNNSTTMVHKQQDAHDSAPEAVKVENQTSAVPSVRRKATVKFSRVQHTYTVHYDQYDGGGELPDAKKIDHLQPANSCRPNSVQEMLKAPVLERPAAEAAVVVSTISDQATKSEATESNTDKIYGNAKGPHLKRGDPPDRESKTSVEVVAPTVVEPTEPEPRAEEQLEEHEEDEGSSGEDLFDKDALYPTDWSKSDFVRAWGVLTSWLTDLAREVLNGARIELAEDLGRIPHKGRRDLLSQMLMSRVPGDLAFLAPRFTDLIGTLGVHQALPSVTEVKLYDFLAALLLRSLYRIEVARGVVETNTYSERVANRQVEQTVRKLKMSDAEIQILDDMLR